MKETFIVHALLRSDGITSQITVLTLFVYHCSNILDFQHPFWGKIKSVVVARGELIFCSVSAAGRLSSNTVRRFKFDGRFTV